MSDFARWVREGGAVKLACSAEFANGGTLRSLEQTYSFHLEPRQKIVLAGGETAATIGAAAARTNGINTAMVYGTDGGIVAADLVLLEDDGKDQPIYAPVPIVREAVLRAHPQIAGIVRPLMAELYARIAAGPERARADRWRVERRRGRRLPAHPGLHRPGLASDEPGTAPRATHRSPGRAAELSWGRSPSPCCRSSSSRRIASCRASRARCTTCCPPPRSPCISRWPPPRSSPCSSSVRAFGCWPHWSAWQRWSSRSRRRPTS